MQTTPGPASLACGVVDLIAAAAAEVVDPVERARALEDAIANLRAAMRPVAALRRQALLEARGTKSVALIAEELGLSPARVYAILSGKD